MMDTQEAMACLADSNNRNISEVGESIDVLYKIHGTYANVAQQLSMSPGFLSSRHHIYQLPKGILWKVDEGQIGISQAEQITRLKDDEDQWLLAITALEKRLRANECERVVNLVVKDGWTIRDALSAVTGIRFDEISPPTLLLPVGVDFWFALIRASWGQSKDWQDLCYQLIREGVDVDNREVAAQLEALAKDLSTQLETIAVTLFQAGEGFTEEVQP